MILNVFFNSTVFVPDTYQDVYTQRLDRRSITS